MEPKLLYNAVVFRMTSSSTVLNFRSRGYDSELEWHIAKFSSTENLSGSSLFSEE